MENLVGFLFSRFLRCQGTEQANDLALVGFVVSEAKQHPAALIIRSCAGVVLGEGVVPLRVDVGLGEIHHDL